VAVRLLIAAALIFDDGRQIDCLDRRAEPVCYRRAGRLGF
jgi:hypothetical protein